jgi:hypothetical protein
MHGLRWRPRALGIGLIAFLATFAPATQGQAGGRPAESPAALANPAAVRCLPGPGATGSPRNIEDMVALINSLPKPVSIPCVVESLDRPLHVFGTNSRASLQLSAGPSDPRLFIFKLPLIISVTTEGHGASLLEVSVVQPGNRRSLKGELRFPLPDRVTHALPYARIREGEGTACGFFCHGAEEQDPRIPFAEAFVSRAIRPSLSSEVGLDTLHRLKLECRPQANPQRCDLLSALLEHGDVQRQDFPAGMSEGF